MDLIDVQLMCGHLRKQERFAIYVTGALTSLGGRVRLLHDAEGSDLPHHSGNGIRVLRLVMCGLPAIETMRLPCRVLATFFFEDEREESMK